MEQKDIEHFDRQLEADDPARVSRGTSALMRMMGVSAMRPPERPAPAQPDAVPTGGGVS